jgi:hypothetical protein
MKGTLHETEQGWIVKWSDLHSFARGDIWEENLLEPEDQLLEDLEEGKKVEFDIEYDHDSSHLFIPRIVIKDLKVNKDRGNKLIAEFMGFERVTIGYFGANDETQWQRDHEDWLDYVGLHSIGEYFVNVEEDKWFECGDGKYHTSWDWIMPVLIEIETQLDVATSIQINRYKDVGHKQLFGETSVCLFEGNHDTIITDAGLKIDAVWEAIVRFLIWYNSKKE